MKTTLLSSTLAITLAASSSAAVQLLPSATDQTQGFTIPNAVTPVTSVAGPVYVTGAINFDNLDTNGAFIAVDLRLNGVEFGISFGQGFSSNEFRGGFSGSGTLTALKTISEDETINFALRIDTVTGNYSIFVNPDYSGVEPVTADYSATTLAAARGGTLSSVQYRGGNNPNNSSLTDFTNFAVYDAGDTPFATIPEPSSTMLLGFGALAISFRRRRKA